MAVALSLSPSLGSQHHEQFHRHFKPLRTFPFASNPILQHPHPAFHRFDLHTFKFPYSPFHSSSTTPNSSYPDDPLYTGRFMSNEEIEKLRLLENFKYCQELESGTMWVRAMREEELDVTVALLAESFAESMVSPIAYVPLLRFLVKQYLIERRTLIPHTATLIAFYKRKVESEEGDQQAEEQLAGTVEVCFDERGANASSPTPTPPKDSPYICNMTVRKPLRRRGIGWNLLKAGEELISQASSSREVYLHCRMIDTVPCNMYIRAGYRVVKTDSILVLLMLQRRKHLMCKNLPVWGSTSEPDVDALIKN